MYYGDFHCGGGCSAGKPHSFLALAEQFELKGLTKHDNIEDVGQIKRSTNKTEMEESSSYVKQNCQR